MVKTVKKDEIIINNYFVSETEEEITLKLSVVIARLINRDLDNAGIEKERDIWKE